MISSSFSPFSMWWLQVPRNYLSVYLLFSLINPDFSPQWKCEIYFICVKTTFHTEALTWSSYPFRAFLVHSVPKMFADIFPNKVAALRVVTIGRPCWCVCGAIDYGRSRSDDIYEILRLCNRKERFRGSTSIFITFLSIGYDNNKGPKPTSYTVTLAPVIIDY